MSVIAYRRWLRSLPLLWLILFMSLPMAHDMTESGNAKWNPLRAAYMPGDHSPKQRPGGPVVPYYVVGLPQRWAIGQDIHMCFVGGSDQLRARIIGVAEIWFQYVNLNLVTGGANGTTCSSNDNSEIRVGFSEPGYWSYVGTDGLDNYLISKGLSSLNLEGFDTAPPAEPRFTGIVLHEMGHALGFEHEHQSPASGCDQEYDWPKLYAYYSRVYNWNQKMVDDNVRQYMTDRSAYAWSQFDPQSIMIYGTDPQFLLKGVSSPCYLHDNNSLSQLDIKGAQTVYPSGDVSELLKARLVALRASVAKLKPGALQKVLKLQADIHEKQIQKLDAAH